MYKVRGEERAHRNVQARVAKVQENPFIGVDGEGIGRGASHRYVLLGVGDRQLEDSGGIHWKDAFEFLYDAYRGNPDAAFVGFFLGYDFTQILRSLPEDRAWYLLTKGGMNARRRKNSGGNPKPFPVRYDGWEFDYLPGRRLQLRPLCTECNAHADNGRSCGHKRSGWMYVCDTGGFWQTSFLNVINPKKWQEPICTEEEYEAIREGKERRDHAALDSSMRYYNALENLVLARAMGSLREGFLGIGVNLRRNQWFGPGQAASEWMKNEGIPRRRDLGESVPDWFTEAARASYFGGWFEIFAHGIIPGTTWEYDINSAYPSIIRSLPCLLHGRWARGTGRPPEGGIAFVYGRFRSEDRYVGSLFNRSRQGHVRRPRVTEGWYEYGEVTAAIRAGVITSADIQNWVRYQPCACPCPGRHMEDLYRDRLRVGKDTLLGKSSKLVYNSAYGKFAQSTGSAPFGNWIYAALITAGCRRMILDAIATHPERTKAVVMVATDGVFFTSRHPSLPISDQLGEWEETRRENLTLFKPGVYWDDRSRVRISAGAFEGFKARGINARDLAGHLDEIDEQFRAAVQAIPESHVRSEAHPAIRRVKKWPEITFTVGFSMTSALTALNRGKWASAGEVFQSVSVTHSSDPSEKRGRSYWDSSFIRTRVMEVPDDEVVSRPYEKRYGDEDPFSQEYAELAGISPDGNISFHLNTIRRVLSGEE